MQNSAHHSERLQDTAANLPGIISNTIPTTTAHSHIASFPDYFIGWDETLSEQLNSEFDVNLKLVLLVSLGQGYYEGSDSYTVLSALARLTSKYPNIEVNIAIADTLQVHNALDPWQLSTGPEDDKNSTIHWLQRQPQQRWQIFRVNNHAKLEHQQPGVIHIYIESQTHEHRIHYYGHFGGYSFIPMADSESREFKGIIVHHNLADQYDLLLRPILNDVAYQAGQRWIHRNCTKFLDTKFSIYDWQKCGTCTSQQRASINALFKTDQVFRLLVLRKIAIYKRSRTNISTSEQRFWKSIADEIDKPYLRGTPSLAELEEKAKNFFCSSAAIGANKAITPEQLQNVMQCLDEEKENYLSYIKEYILSETAVLMYGWAGRCSHILYNHADEPLFDYVLRHYQVKNNPLPYPPRWASYDVLKDNLVTTLQQHIASLKIKGLQDVSYVTPHIQATYAADDDLQHVCFYYSGQNPIGTVPAGCCAIWKSVLSPSSVWCMTYGDMVELLPHDETLVHILEQDEWNADIQQQLRHNIQKLRRTQNFSSCRQRIDFSIGRTVITDSILQNWLAIGACRYLLMQGNSGSGKSSWAKHFAQKNSISHKFSYVLWVDMQLLVEHTPPLPKGKSWLLHYLESYFPKYMTKTKDLRERELKRSVRYYYECLRQESTLFIIDNYRPYDTSAEKIQAFIKTIQELPHARLVVTTHAEYAQHKMTTVTQVVSMQGFTETGVLAYLKQCLMNKAIPLFDKIKTQGLLPIAQQPMLLSILAYLAQSKNFHLLQLSVTQLFDALFAQAFTHVMDTLAFKFLQKNKNPQKTYFYDKNKQALVEPGKKIDKINMNWFSEIAEGNAALCMFAENEEPIEQLLRWTTHCTLKDDGMPFFSLTNMQPELEKYFKELNERIQANHTEHDASYLEHCRQALYNDIEDNKIPPKLRQYIFSGACPKLEKQALTLLVYCEQKEDGTWLFSTADPSEKLSNYFQTLNANVQKYSKKQNTPLNYFKLCCEQLSKDIKNDNIPLILKQQIVDMMRIRLANAIDANFAKSSLAAIPHHCLSSIFLDNLRFLTRTTDGYMMHDTVRLYLIASQFAQRLDLLEAMLHSKESNSFSLHHHLLLWQLTIGLLAQKIDLRAKNFDDLVRIMEALWINSKQDGYSFYNLLCCEEQALSNVQIVDSDVAVQLKKKFSQLNVNIIKEAADCNTLRKQALCNACEHGSIENVRTLIELGVNPNTTIGYTPLQLATWHGHLEIISLLLKANADPHHGTVGSVPPFIEACYQGWPDLIEIFVAHSKEKSWLLQLCTTKYGGGPSAIIAASNLKNYENEEIISYLVKQLQAAGNNAADINALLCHRDDQGSTALLVASANGDTYLLGYLIKQLQKTGSSPTDINALLCAKDNQGRTALLVASANADPDMLGYLIRQLKETGSSPTDINAFLHHPDNQGNTAALLASASGHLDILEELIEQLNITGSSPTDINALLCAQDNQGRTALIRAIENEHADMLDYLIKQLKKSGSSPADINALLRHPDNQGSTALLLASANGYVNMLDDLIEQLKVTGSSNADIDALLRHHDNQGNTALLLASAYGHITMLDYLILYRLEITRSSLSDIRAQLCHKNNDGSTILMVASIAGHIKMLEYLINQLRATGTLAAEINTLLCHKDNHGNSALIIASEHGHLDVIEYIIIQLRATGSSLVDIRTQLCHQNDSGSTALLLASATGYIDILRYIIKQLRATGSNPADINMLLCHEDDAGNTGLLLAGANGHINVLDYLIEQLKANGSSNADINTLLCYQDNVFLLASANRHIHALEYLIKQLKATGSSDEHISNLLCHQDHEGNTAFLLASANGDTDMLRYLIKQLKATSISDISLSTILNQKDANGMDARTLAEQNGYPETVHYLEQLLAPPPVTKSILPDIHHDIEMDIASSLSGITVTSSTAILSTLNSTSGLHSGPSAEGFVNATFAIFAPLHNSSFAATSTQTSSPEADKHATSTIAIDDTSSSASDHDTLLESNIAANSSTNTSEAKDKNDTINFQCNGSSQ